MIINIIIHVITCIIHHTCDQLTTHSHTLKTSNYFQNAQPFCIGSQQTTVLIHFEVWAKLAQQWLVCAPL